MSGFRTDEAREVLSVTLCHVGGVILDRDDIIHIPVDEERTVTREAIDTFPIPEWYKVSFHSTFFSCNVFHKPQRNLPL